MLNAVLFKSKERFDSFRNKLAEYDIACTVLDFDDHSWIDFDFSKIDFAIYYPSFEYSSSHPLALRKVHDNLSFLNESWPHLQLFPDPAGVKYYNDKYKQFLYLKTSNYPIPETVPLFSEKSIDIAEKQLGYPMVIKNRYGAGGGSVFRALDRKELEKYYKVSTLNLFDLDSARYLAEMFGKRIFYYHLIKEKRMPYPFLSAPLLAQKFIKLDRDLKTVVGGGKVVEAHWRFQANEDMWKVNIDGGGTGVWGQVPQEALDLSIRLAGELKVSWLNLDLIMENDKFLITEFSPVWHHYAYKEKPSFVYKDDYNIAVPLEVSLDLERIIVESLIESVGERGKRRANGKRQTAKGERGKAGG